MIMRCSRIVDYTYIGESPSPYLFKVQLFMVVGFTWWLLVAFFTGSKFIVNRAEFEVIFHVL